MSAIPIVQFDRGFQEIMRGTLHDCPAEFFSMSQMSFYQGCKAGWNKCPLGYWTYSAFDAMGRKLVVPGIILPGEPKPKRKFPDYRIVFSKVQIEKFLQPILNMSGEIKLQRDSEFKNLTHDLRAVGAEIYSTALVARSNAEHRSEMDSVKLLDDILAAQQMLSIRLDVVDYESGYAASQPKQSIPIFKKIDKVLRCFGVKFKKINMRYIINGNSFGFILGPPLFEIIPFVIVENAIKYAPYGSELHIRFLEGADDIVVHFESLGPKIRPNERDRIFENQYRGDAAKSSERVGSGIGLYAAKTLVESHYDGHISVEQSDAAAHFHGIEYFLTTFTLKFSRHDRITPVSQSRGVGKSRLLRNLFAK